MNEDKDYYTVMAMKRYGGSFVNQLGSLFQFADSGNKEKLRGAFPEYFKQYEEMGDKIRTGEEK